MKPCLPQPGRPGASQVVLPQSGETVEEIRCQVLQGTCSHEFTLPPGLLRWTRSMPSLRSSAWASWPEARVFVHSEPHPASDIPESWACRVGWLLDVYWTPSKHLHSPAFSSLHELLLSRNFAAYPPIMNLLPSNTLRTHCLLIPPSQSLSPRSPCHTVPHPHRDPAFHLLIAFQ